MFVLQVYHVLCFMFVAEMYHLLFSVAGVSCALFHLSAVQQEA